MLENFKFFAIFFKDLSSQIKRKTSKISSLNIKFIGCYQTGHFWYRLEKGLTSEMAHNTYPTEIYVAQNQNIIIKHPNMTIEACASICLLNKFKYAGLNLG